MGLDVMRKNGAAVLMLQTMQQTQQILLSVKHKLPEPNSILPSELIKSEQAHHIRRRVHDVPAVSSYNWPLDHGCQSNKDRISGILANYYGPEYQISQLLKWQHKIVFLNPMVHPSQCQQDNYYFGSISSTIIKPRKSTCNPLVHESTYQLEFDDKIESGNLYFALQHEPQVYLLANRLDYNTRSYGQWFYFKVKNVTDRNGMFKFCIVNMTKNGTMFGRGLKVSVCRKGVWTKEGTEIEYFQNKFIRKRSLQTRGNIFPNQTYYTLTFSLPIDAHESIYVAYNQPYSYTNLCQKLDSISNRHPNVSRSVIARTPLGNRIEIVTITNKNSVANKKIIFITARAHPVETAGSFVAEGIIDELLTPSEPFIVNQLLDNYLIKIVPMINPDGVIVGNSRCNIYGFDLNRQWKDPAKNTAPQILCLKRAILKYEGRIQMFLDLHGHSTKKNVFAYGCHDIKNPIASRQFPYLLSKFSTTDFVYSQCRFSMLTQSKNNGKDGTARVSLWRKLKIPNIFTIQNSYCCAEGSDYHYDSRSYASIGKDIVFSLCSYFQKPESNPEKGGSIYEQGSSNQLKSAESVSKSLNFSKQALLSELHNNLSLININVRDSSQVSSQSETEDRVEMRQIEVTPKKMHKDLSSKTYIKPKVDKINRQSILKNNAQLGKFKKNATIEPKESKQDETNDLSPPSGQKFRRKYLRNLSPLTKESMPVKPLRTQSGLNEEHPQLTKRGDSQPQLTKQRNTSLTQKKTNTISIIQLGMESELSNTRDNAQMIMKAVSAKNINSQYGIYHNRLNTLNGSHSQSKSPVKYLKNIICPAPEVQTFTDTNQFKQPVLKVKKNLCRNVSKLQEFISKINAIQSNISVRNLSTNNTPLLTLRNLNNSINNSTTNK